ncbi:MAG TPA: hypothetical protein VID28_04260 [Methylomirabilota bacterium]|jgi:hypothetical protein
MLLVLRTPLLAIVLSVAAMLPALAHATPPDSTWIAGLYDDADFDDIVVRITSGTGDVPVGLPTDLRPLHALVLGLTPSWEPAPTALDGFALQPRAPPAR